MNATRVPRSIPLPAAAIVSHTGFTAVGSARIGDLDYPGAWRSDRGGALELSPQAALGGRCHAWVGVDPATSGGSIRIHAEADGCCCFDSGAIPFQAPPRDGGNPARALGVLLPIPSQGTIRLAVEILEAAEGLAILIADLRLVPPGGLPYDPPPPVTGTAWTLPPLGFETWNSIGFGLTDHLIYELAEAQVANGLAAAGYRILGLDEPGFTERDAQGRLVDQGWRYRGGLAEVGRDIQALGLRLGCYTDALPTTCGGFVGSFGHYESDAATFAAWGVDYLKVDWMVNPEGHAAAACYTAMGQALRATGRDICYSVCHWGQATHDFVRAAGGHTWRSTFDLVERWNSPQDGGPTGVLRVLDQTAALAAHHGPGCFVDPDMLVVGLHGGGRIGARERLIKRTGWPDLDAAAYRSHFALWCMLGAPLLIGADVRHLDPASFALLTNPLLLAIDQDPACLMAWRAWRQQSAEAWLRPLANGDWALLLLNRGYQPISCHVPLAHLGLPPGCTAIDCLRRRPAGQFDHDVSATLQGRDCAVWRISVSDAP